MSWWDTKNLANFATQALKTAQKRIDKVLDIKEEETGMDELVKSLNFEIRLACDDVECFCLILNVVGHLLIFKNKFSAKYSPYTLHISCLTDWIDSFVIWLLLVDHDRFHEVL